MKTKQLSTETKGTNEKHREPKNGLHELLILFEQIESLCIRATRNSICAPIAIPSKILFHFDLSTNVLECIQIPVKLVCSKSISRFAFAGIILSVSRNVEPWMMYIQGN